MLCFLFLFINPCIAVTFDCLYYFQKDAIEFLNTLFEYPFYITGRVMHGKNIVLKWVERL